jgi:concanavalin A-like lectin/glucanase superfamily protein
LPRGTHGTGSPTARLSRASRRYAAAVLHDRPVAYYRFNDRQDGRIRDASGHHHTARLRGWAFRSTEGLLDARDPALSLRGGTVTIPDAPTLRLRRPFAIEFWIRRDGPIRHTPPLLFKKGSWLMWGADTVGNRLVFQERFHGRSAAAKVIHGQLGNPRHVVFQCRRSGRCAWYVNGRLQEAQRGAHQPDRSRSPIRLGGARGFPLTIDELAFYRHALPVRRIRAHFAAVRPAAGPKLTWAPPKLTDPITINLPLPTSGDLTLSGNRDYVIQMPAQPLQSNGRDGALWINGGRNVVVIGGEIRIDPQAGQDARRAVIAQNYRTLHLEGLWIHGDDVNEGIDPSTQHRGTTVQLENIRVDHLRSRDEVNFSNGDHPDLVEFVGGSAGSSEARIDRLTGSGDYQGLQFAGVPTVTGATIRNVDIESDPTPFSRGRQMIWMADPKAIPYRLANVYVRPPTTAVGNPQPLGNSVHPSVLDADPTVRPTVDATGALLWPATTLITGAVRPGPPPLGHFVTGGDGSRNAGIDYVPPGYGTP